MIPRFLLSHANNLRRLFVVFTCLVCLEQLVSHLRQEKEQVPLGAARSTTLLTRHAEPAKLILLWNEYQMIGKKIYENIFRRITDGHCPVSNCRFTTDRSLQNSSSAIIFHMPNLHWENYTYPKYRDLAVPWIFMTYETATNVKQRSSNWGRHPPINWQKINSVFNRTMSFRKDSDVVVRHGYVEKRLTPLTDEELKEAYSQEPRPDFSKYTYEAFSKGKAGQAPIAWFVSHCKAHSGRDKYINWLSKWIGVDIYGRCGNLTCGEVKNIKQEYSTDEDPCFHMVNKRYRFYISFENAICKDYITEKTFNALRLNTIPIVLGGVNYTAELPPNSYINAAQFITPQDLADYLYSLLGNESLYLKYFEWRRHYSVHSFTSVPDPCHLCEKLHSGEWKRAHTYHKMYDWFIQRSRCIFTRIVWTLAGFEESWKIAGERSLSGSANGTLSTGRTIQ